MILRLNEYQPFKTSKIRNESAFIDNYNYPRQFKNFIGKKVQLRFKDMSSGIVYPRLPINEISHPEFEGIPGEESIWWKIVRMDCEYPYTCILIEKNNSDNNRDNSSYIPRVIVCRSNKITDLVFYPGYVAEEDEIDINRTTDYDEYHLVSEDTWEDFNEAYKDDYIHEYPIQNYQLIGMTTYSQYPRNLLKLDYDNPLIPEEARQWRDIAWNERVDKELSFSEPKYAENYKTVAKFAESYRDVPQRPINKGIIIRCDMDPEGHPHFVVRENARHYNENKEIVIEQAYRYITEEDAVVFINMDNINNTKESVSAILKEEQIWD